MKKLPKAPWFAERDREQLSVPLLFPGDHAMLRNFVRAVVVSMVFAGTLLAENRVKGVIKSVDAEKGTLTVTVQKKDQEFTITDQTKLTLAPEGKGIKNRLKDPVFKAGASVAVTTDTKDGK